MSLDDADTFQAAADGVLSNADGALGAGAYGVAVGLALLLGATFWMLARRRTGSNALAQSVRGPAMTGLAALGVFVGVMAMWSWLVPLSGAAVAPGVFSPMGDTKTVIYGFNVQLPPAVKRLAQRDRVEVRLYSVIYELLDNAKQSMSDLLAPDVVETEVG